MKKLPELYTNTFNKKIDNSLEYISIPKETIENNTDLSKYSLNKKIENIFKSKNYIYKIKVEISYQNETTTETIIGKTKNNLITIDNKLININDILDIKKVD